MEFTKGFNNIKNFALDTLFPIACLDCKKPGTWLCNNCLDKIEIISSQVCPYCEKILMPSGKICPKCRSIFLNKGKSISLDALICATRYQKNNISKLIYLFKYNFVSDLSISLGKILVKALLENNFPLPDIIVPVPLHSRRERWRGFNQSQLLADYISQSLAPGISIPVYSGLVFRKKYTKPQMKIKNYQERQRNIKNIFSIIPSHPLTGEDARRAGEGKNINDKTILLIDDIATTGSTLFECSRVLKQNGARSILGAVIARQEIKS